MVPKRTARQGQNRSRIPEEELIRLAEVIEGDVPETVEPHLVDVHDLNESLLRELIEDARRDPDSGDPGRPTNFDLRAVATYARLAATGLWGPGLLDQLAIEVDAKTRQPASVRKALQRLKAALRKDLDAVRAFDPRLDDLTRRVEAVDIETLEAALKVLNHIPWAN